MTEREEKYKLVTICN